MTPSPGARERTDGGAPRAAPPFIGRAAELGWLVRGLEAAVAGQPQVALVVGDPGIGKTRLLRELQRIAGARGVAVAAGRGHEDVAAPFLPMTEALAEQFRTMPASVARALGADAEMARQLVSGGFGASPPARAWAAEPAGLERFPAVSRALIALARVGPILLVLDDLHWIDRASLELLAHLVFATADAVATAPVRLLIVAATRPPVPEQRLARILARLQCEAICQTLDLTGLTELEVLQLVQALGLRRPSHQLVDAVAVATHGNPLFVAEVVLHLRKHGEIVERGGFLTTTSWPIEMKLPADVSAAIAGRVGELDPGVRQTLVRAAALGVPFTLSTLATVADLDAEAAAAAVADGVRRGLLTEEDGRFQFSHPLVRQAVYEALPPAWRHRLHAELADALLASYGERAGEHAIEIAHHMVAAGPAVEPRRVAEHARNAADRAFASGAWHDAACYYDAALGAGEAASALTASARAELHHLAGFAYYRDQDAGPCLDHYERAITDSRTTGDVRGLARALMGRARAQFTLASVSYGTLIDPAPLADAAEQLEVTDPVLCGFVRAELAQIFWTARQPAPAETMARLALETAERHHEEVLAAEAHRALALICGQRLRVREAVDHLWAGLACARRAGDSWREGQILQRLPLNLVWLGRLDEAESIAREAAAIVQVTHDWGDHSLALGALTCIAVARGDFEAAERHAHQAMLMRHRSGYPWAGPTALPALACARALRGSWAEAEDALVILAEPGQVFEDPGPGVVGASLLLRQLVANQGDPSPAARVALAERLEPLVGTLVSDVAEDVYGYGLLAAAMDIAELVGAPAIAGAVGKPLADAADRGLVFTTGWACLVSRALGVAATLGGDFERAAEYLEAAVVQARALGARPELGRAELGLATMLVARGRRTDRSRAGDLTARALGRFRELGMVPFVRAATELASRLEARLSAPPRRGSIARAGLSAQEVTVLGQIARGRSEREIAGELVLRPDTAARLVGSLLRKLGARTGAEASARAVEIGILPAAMLGPAPAARQLVVILFTDVVRSTALLERLGDARARALLRTHDRIVREWLGRSGGVEVKHTGDGLMATFPSALYALECAVGIQRALAAHARAHPDRPIPIRIGLDAGEPIAEEGDLFGAAVSAAARICARARSGQILVSEVVRHLARGTELLFVDRGRVALRGFSKRVRLYEVPW